MSELKTKVVHGAFWVLLQRFSTQFVSFFVTLILARLLTPSDYGSVALLSIFTQVAGILVDSGLGTALVQKKDASELDFNSMFYASITIALVCYGILFVAAPYIADWYAVPDLKWMLRLIAFSLIFSAMNSVQGAELSRKMLFHLSFRISLITCFTSATVGVTLAYLSYGPWAIAWQGVISGIVGVAANWFIIAWRPRLMFSWQSLKGLLKYGWNIASVSVIFSIYSNVYSLVIGKAYSKEDLAVVNKGQSLPTLASDTVSNTICRVSFPALSQIQDDVLRVRSAVKRMITCSVFLVFPLMTGVAICADDLVFVLFGDKWLPCVPYMRLACFSLALQPMQDVNLQTIAALGRSDVFLKLQFIKTGFGCLLMVLFLRHSVFAFMAAAAFTLGPLALYVNAWHNRKFIDYSFFRQVHDVLPMVGNCAVMAVCVFGVGMLFPVYGASVPLSVAKMIVQGGVGVFVYFALSAAFKIPALTEYLRIPLARLEGRMPHIAALLKRLIVHDDQG